MWICYSIFIEKLGFIREKIYLMIRATRLLGLLTQLVKKCDIYISKLLI